LFELLRACGEKEALESFIASQQAGTLRYADLKETVADTVVGLCNPIREKLHEIQANKKAVKEQIKESSANIRKKASQTLREVKEICGLGNPK
jgi:tryptophanyl-tRNA synthetase